MPGGTPLERVLGYIPDLGAQPRRGTSESETPPSDGPRGRVISVPLSDGEANSVILPGAILSDSEDLTHVRAMGNVLFWISVFNLCSSITYSLSFATVPRAKHRNRRLGST